MVDFGLRGYQIEVVQRALKGENSIIWLPTGGGKTRAAVYVAKMHLETTRNAKVAVLVNKVHLVDQHYSKEFNPHLGRNYELVAISGDSSQKDFFAHVVKDCDLIICTAQILENALISNEEEKHVELTDFTLLIIDECHHTHKDGVYNKIMARYVESRLRNPETRLPQILGLTASPGTGGNRSIDGAVKHVLQICANLDSVIVSSKEYVPELSKVVPKPRKTYDIVEERLEDPFGSHLKMMMGMIHDFMGQGKEVKFRAFGTQEYEADVVQLEKTGVQEENRLVAQCALHLRKYNDALLINDTVRMIDALRVLHEFYLTKQENILDVTDMFLTGLFEENRVELKELASNPIYENPKLAQLEKTLVKQFDGKDDSKGIIFSKTREGTRCLYDWVCANPELQRVNIRASILTGAGTGANHMTQRGQKETILQFRKGTLNVLISTSVAEEGLDIPECNLVVRYGLLTNEIAQQQASGRARAADSTYSVVAQAGGREVRRERTNEYLEELTSRAVAQVQRMDLREFRQEIKQLQMESVMSRIMAESQRNTRRSQHSGAQVELICRGCFAVVGRGNDMRVFEGTHHININPDFKVYYKIGGQVQLERTFEDWEPGRVISCATCGKDWGMEILIKKLMKPLPCLKIKSFSLKTPEGSRSPKKWKDVPFTVEELEMEEYVTRHFPDLWLD
ncbi:ATP-dependent RNA helicase DHX58 [Chanos chanos]|uniref:RNA helicase n=1 Tax=Chanos chanos TaxID=29144 RepID=A0A6J2WYW2_CHACN|nr:probable ATP-dependent RNA helicase DHX58 [Chanos chanos]